MWKGHKVSLEPDAMAPGGVRAQVVSATPRQLESLVRLSEALARMRLGAHRGGR